jgi:hypothetical protein
MVFCRAVLIGALIASAAAGQNTISGAAVVVGQVRAAESGQPLPYSVVSIASLGREQFTSEQGGFTIWNLAPGRLALRVKRIGYSPRDTAVTLRPNDTLRVEIALTRLVIELPAVRVSGACGDKRPDERMVATLADLFDQVQQNADRYRLYADSNPFNLIMYRVRGVRDNKGKILATQIDTIRRGPFPFAMYSPRHIVRSVADSEAGGMIRHYLSPPELADFADTAFINNHCFTYAGKRVVANDSVIAVDFEPVPALKGEVDFRGTMFVRAADFQLVRADLQLNRLPPEMRSSGMTSMNITTRFTEVLPGVAIIDQVESSTKFSGRPYPWVEFGQVFDMKWIRKPLP